MNNLFSEKTKTLLYGRFALAGLAIFAAVFFAVRIVQASLIPDADESFINMFAEVMKLISALFTIAMVYAILFVKIPPQKLVVAGVLSLGIIYIFILTPFSISDEQYHYHSAMKLSNTLTLKMDDKNAIAADYNDYHYLITHENSADAYLRMKDPVFTDQSQLKKFPNRYQKTYMVQYIPQALGVTLAKALHLNFIWLFYLGRLFNLLFFMICAYIAVKKMPFQKYLVVLIAIMPMSVQLAASLSYDTFINGLSILLVASIMESIYKKGAIAVSEILWITVTAALLAPTKNVYCLLVLLAIFIPKERFSSTMSNLLSKALMIGAGFVAILLISLPAVNNIVDTRHSTKFGTDSYHFTDILNDPVGAAKIFLSTIKARAAYWIFSMLGYRFGLSAPKLPMGMFAVYALLLAVIPFTRDTNASSGGGEVHYKDEEKRHNGKPALPHRIAGSIRGIGKNHRKERDVYHEVIGKTGLFITMKMKIALFCIAVFTLLLVMLSMYLSYTPANSAVIGGVQGRYLIPLLLPALLILKNLRLTITPKVIAPVLCAAFVLHFIIFNYGLVVTLSGL